MQCAHCRRCSRAAPRRTAHPAPGPRLCLLQGERSRLSYQHGERQRRSSAGLTLVGQRGGRSGSRQRGCDQHSPKDEAPPGKHPTAAATAQRLRSTTPPWGPVGRCELWRGERESGQSAGQPPVPLLHGNPPHPTASLLYGTPLPAGGEGCALSHPPKPLMCWEQKCWQSKTQRSKTLGEILKCCFKRREVSALLFFLLLHAVGTENSNSHTNQTVCKELIVTAWQEQLSGSLNFLCSDAKWKRLQTEALWDRRGAAAQLQNPFVFTSSFTGIPGSSRLRAAQTLGAEQQVLTWLTRAGGCWSPSGVSEMPEPLCCGSTAVRSQPLVHMQQSHQLSWNRRRTFLHPPHLSAFHPSQH